MHGRVWESIAFRIRRWTPFREGQEETSVFQLKMIHLGMEGSGIYETMDKIMSMIVRWMNGKVSGEPMLPGN